MSIKTISKQAATVAIAAALTIGAGAGIAQAGGPTQGAVTGGYAKTDLPPTDSQLLSYNNSSKKVKVSSTLKGISGVDKTMYQGKWTGAYDIYVSEGDTQKFKLSWQGFKGRKVVAWVRASGTVGLSDSWSSWQRIELPNKRGKNTKTIDYTFTATNAYGYWGGFQTWIVDAKGNWARGDATGSVKFYAFPASERGKIRTPAAAMW